MSTSLNRLEFARSTKKPARTITCYLTDVILKPEFAFDLIVDHASIPCILRELIDSLLTHKKDTGNKRYYNTTDSIFGGFEV